jgi:hypothetical protein
VSTKTVYDELLEIADRYKAASAEHRELRARADDEDSKSLAEDLYRDARRALERFESIEGELNRWIDQHSDWDYMEHGTLIKAVRELAQPSLPDDAREALVWIRDQGAGDTVGVYDRARFLARRLLS